MDMVSNLGGSAGIVSRIVVFIVILVLLYYLYQYLYSPSSFVSKTLNPGIQNASMNTPVTVTATNLPVLYEGGEFTTSAWIYVNDYAVRKGYNKHVMSIGGSTFNTIVVYLGPYSNSLSVRVQTKSNASAAGSNSNQNADDLYAASYNSMFSTLQTDNGLLNQLRPCDIQTVELQKWVLVTVVLNNTTCDVYMDGKLARSCVLPSFFKVDRTGLSAKLCDNSGFGGFIGPTNAYGYALNPEQVWRLYMAGPGPQYSFTDYVTSLFNPSAIGTLAYPKMNA